MILRKRFCWFISKRWKSSVPANMPTSSAIYIIVKCHLIRKSRDIVYIGSSTNLMKRFKGHVVYLNVWKNKNHFPIIFYLEMKKGFYDYEIKLIKRLKPKLNKQHVNG